MLGINSRKMLALPSPIYNLAMHSCIKYKMLHGPWTDLVRLSLYHFPPPVIDRLHCIDTLLNSLFSQYALFLETVEIPKI